MTISSTNRKAGPYIGNGTTTVFPFYFKVFTAADVEVVRLTVATNVEVVLALTTNYTVTLNTDQNANPGGSITLVAGALASGYNLVITSAIGNLQPTDLTNQGGFYPDVINDALDRATIQIQQLQEGLDRAALLPITSAADSAALVADIERLASSADNLDIDANNIASINTVAGAISNVNSVATNISNVNAVAGNATNINAVNSNSTNINAVNSNKTNIDTVAGNNTNITTVAGISANVTTVAGISSNVTSVAGNSTNINAVAGNATNINAVNANSTNINTVATNNTAINSVYTNMTAVTSAYTNIAAIIDAPTQAANAASSAAQAAASAASGMYSAVQDKSANYTILAADAGDLIRVTTTSGAITITLPLIGSTGITDGFKIAVVKWTSDANAVNIARSGSNTINGATSAQIGSQYSQIIFVADAETSTWFASQSGLGATNVNVDVFSGNGGTTFTLTADPSTKNNTTVEISGVYQAKSTYSVSGTTLTFSTAPPTGTNNIEVIYGTPLAIGTPSDGTVTTAKIADASITTAKVADANITSVKLSSDAQYMGFKNRIINGAMMISQRGASPTITGGGDYSLDRFGSYYSGNAFTSVQSTTAPAGFINSMLFTVSTTSASPTYSFFYQKIEGLNCADLGFGLSTASTVTISFWVRSSVTGIYSIGLGNSAGDRSYAVQYTINSANTWEQKTITIAGDQSGTWLTTNGVGFYLRWNLGTSSGSRLISAGSWQAANADGATGSTGANTWANTSGATFYITGVQLEKGSTATSFDYRPYGNELALCRRYCQVFKGSDSSNNYTRIGLGPAQGAGSGVTWRWVDTPFRIAPSITYSGSFAVYNGANVTAITGLNMDPATTVNTLAVNWSGASGLTATAYYEIITNNSASSYAIFSAEL
ncbi:hypothetical protein UFOVP77_11 [uncultured Caudovirales phage]|uniref:Tail fiber protein n=1 Tax=uncultured Caudovirales phage TaxID=2100421 RepID=A0A6J5L0A4_9CAUD|nr:hypothetical protein UFOVP77_11 [uncultured Caudovirales phage]